MQIDDQRKLLQNVIDFIVDECIDELGSAYVSQCYEHGVNDALAAVELMIDRLDISVNELKLRSDVVGYGSDL